VEVADDLATAVRGAWMVVEAVPEKLDIKREVFGELDRLADGNAIVAGNSSALPTSQFIDEVEHPERVLNTHYMQPPEQNSVELMSCGKTDPGVIDALMEMLPQYGMVPFHVRRESDGFIFNRVCAAIKRECLMVVEEGRGAGGPGRHVEDLHCARRSAVRDDGPSRVGRSTQDRGALRLGPRRHTRGPAQASRRVCR